MDMKGRDVVSQEAAYRLTNGKLVHHPNINFMRFDLGDKSEQREYFRHFFSKNINPFHFVMSLLC